MNKKERDFVKVVWEFYRNNKRSYLPWRQTTDPYCICVSELMLQQTQVERVIPKYEAFVKRWPDTVRLASASLSEVLTQWQGLGYNRRAKYLHECAKTIVKKHDGVFPKDKSALEALPGIGSYTAGAIMAFAYNEPVSLIETNIRTVFLHHFFTGKREVSDQEILQFVAKTIPTNQSREWYAALMDYGSHLKQTVGNLNQQSRSYTKQSKFSGSDRQIRGAIIRVLTKKPLSKTELVSVLSEFEIARIYQQLIKLMKEELIILEKRKYKLP